MNQNIGDRVNVSSPKNQEKVLLIKYKRNPARIRKYYFTQMQFMILNFDNYINYKIKSLNSLL